MFRGLGPFDILVVAIIALLLFGRQLLDVIDSLLTPSRLGRHEQHRVERLVRAFESAGIVIVITLAVLMITRIVVHLLR